MPPQPAHLDPSALGTKAHWDAAYTLELTNFSSNADDEGTIWFSDAGAEERMLSFLENLSDEGVLVKEAPEDAENAHGAAGGKTLTRFLDLGTGNGHLLFALSEEGWQGEMLGVDYSAKSVQLARDIRHSKGDDYTGVRFEQWDILTQNAGDWLKGGFDVVLDKGTFDAICLSQEMDTQGRRICEGYRARVEKLVKKGGCFLITSCNWTEEELKTWFEVDGGELVFMDKVKYPSFTFGGKSGTSVATLCFTRRDDAK
ncbi:S-adenosyl-L-methionine-dependent methyltransferase [Polyplosphaeria fusca]|uniref:Protein-lysine N-methyltransferase EFM4 n=1 Tax=Polyplosphaeria fusca TaxID=682080 RepID=A0A9P4UUR9_9PLEO|nr:S-adenosyl-L-methionine-dependent methyltransferase [Polyplosphaeria fusca]